MSVDFVETREHMQKALEIIKAELTSIRTGRAQPAIVENIVCAVYGGTQHLKVIELGQINAPTPGMIVIAPWDTSIIGDIRQSIQASNVGLTPIIDGDVIRIQIPPLSQERREEFVKLLRQQLENGKIMIRQIRHDMMSKIKRDFDEKLISEDENFRSEQDLQKITDEFVKQIEEMGEKKEAELMAI
jgi:ribosome recycling factor